MKNTPRPPSVLRDVDAHVPSKVLSRPHRQAVKPPAIRTVARPVESAAPPAMPMPAETASQMEARGRQEGYDAGVREGLKDAQQQIHDHLQAQGARLEAQARSQAEQQAQEHTQRMERLDQLLDGLRVATLVRLEQLEPDAVALAYEAVCKLLGHHTLEREVVAAVVAQASQQLSSGTLLKIRLHPADLALLADHPTCEDLAQRHPTVQWETDVASPRGSCVLATNHGTLDASLLVQLERLRELWRAGASS